MRSLSQSSGRSLSESSGRMEYMFHARPVGGKPRALPRLRKDPRAILTPSFYLPRSRELAAFGQWSVVSGQCPEALQTAGHWPLTTGHWPRWARSLLRAKWRACAPCPNGEPVKP